MIQDYSRINSETCFVCPCLSVSQPPCSYMFSMSIYGLPQTNFVIYMFLFFAIYVCDLGICFTSQCGAMYVQPFMNFVSDSWWPPPAAAFQHRYWQADFGIGGRLPSGLYRLYPMLIIGLSIRRFLP